jgi:glycosyltransferase involved in cell wall biosynthesis
MLYNLAVVIPVYNEEACIETVIKSWYDMLSDLNMNFLIIALNDGSQDGAADVLARFADNERISIINKKNSGHGSSILMGYHKAVKIAQWVFQCDSDDEMKADYFPKLWAERQKYVALFGVRENRTQNLARKLISAVSRLTIKLLFGKGVIDVNTPYRLMRSDVLKPIIKQIPANTFAPNLIISGTLAQSELSLYHVPIPYQSRKTGKVSIIKWQLWRAAILSFWQTLRCRPKINEMTFSHEQPNITQDRKL